MAISSTGIGSGLDVSSIVSQLVALERQPIQKLQSAASEVKTQISAYGKVQSLMTGLRDAAAALAKPALWTQATPTASDSSVLGATVTGAVAAGDYVVSVSQLARAHTIYSKAIQTVPAVLGAGSLTLQLVQDNGPPPTPKDGTSAVTLDFTDPSTTLEQVRDRINASGAGVTASVVRDASGAARLALAAKATGLNDQIHITTSGAGMADLAYPPDAGVGMTQGQAAQNAQFTVNGVPVESTSNQVTGAVEGLTLNLSKESASPVTLTLASDTAAQKKAMDDFVTAYNALNSYLVEQTKYDQATKTAGSLQGDSVAYGLRNQLRSLFNQGSGASSVFNSLRSVGFDTASDGTLKLDSTKAAEALKQPAELAKLFGNTDAAVADNNGFGVRFRQLADRLTGIDGALSTRTQGLNDKLKRNQTEQERQEARVARIQARLEKHYQSLDTKMGSLSSLSSYVTQQMNLLLKNSSS